MGVSIDGISRRMQDERLVVLTREEADGVVRTAEVLAKHDTLGEGDLLVLSLPGGHATLEQSDDDTFILRRFDDTRELELFVERRLDQYERMWDGCGCRVDYFEEI